MSAVKAGGQPAGATTGAGGAPAADPDNDVEQDEQLTPSKTSSPVSGSDASAAYRTVMVIASRKPPAFTVEKRYIPKAFLGVGAYAVVCSALDLKTGKMVCIKRIDGCWRRRALAKSTLRELRLLRHFRPHANILGLKRVMRPRSRKLDSVYVVLELMDMTLDQAIRSPNNLSDDHIQFFLYQLLCGLKYIHSANVVHCDLKPQNLLLNLNCDLKIADFGLARYGSMEHATALFTLWYRPPEILMKRGGYTSKTDMWAVGCILAELLCRKPLLPGRDEFHQLQLVRDILGLNSSTVWQRKETLSPEAKDPGAAPKVDVNARTPLLDRLRKYAPKANELALDLVVRLLSFNPDHRPSAAEALSHQYLADLHDEADEIAMEKPLDPLEFEFEHKGYSKNKTRENLYREVVDHYPPDTYIPPAEKEPKEAIVLEDRRRRHKRRPQRRKSL